MLTNFNIVKPLIVLLLQLNNTRDYDLKLDQLRVNNRLVQFDHLRTQQSNYNWTTFRI